MKKQFQNQTNFLEHHLYPKGLLLCLAFLLGLSTFLPGQEERTLRLERIEVEGNHKTRVSVIENHLDLTIGGTITKIDVEAAAARLDQTRFFKSSEVRIVPGSEKGSAVLLVVVEERRWPFFQFKSGFNELDGWYISPLGLRFDNLLGYGNYFGYELLIGDRIAAGRLSYIRPYLLGSEYDAGIYFQTNTRQFIHYPLGATLLDQAYLQDVEAGELGLTLSGNSGIPRFFSLGLSAQNVTVDTLLVRKGDGEKLAAPEGLRTITSPFQTGRIQLAFNLDTRNRRGYPTQGWWGSVSWEHIVFQSDSLAFADIKYSRTIVDLRRYQPIWKNMVGALRLKYAQITERSPFFERFYLGGPNSLRGYEDRSQNPLGYASRMTLATGEIRFPLSRRIKDPSRFVGVLFYDAGYAWNEGQEWKLRRMKAGLGAGVRIKLPIIGVLRMDLAYPIPNYDDPRLHISLGQTF